MNSQELLQLSETLAAIANGKEWECEWKDGWGHPGGRDIEYCIAYHIPIRIKPKDPMYQYTADAFHGMLDALKIARDEFERLNGAGTCPSDVEDAIAKAEGRES